MSSRAARLHREILGERERKKEKEGDRQMEEPGRGTPGRASLRLLSHRRDSSCGARRARGRRGPVWAVNLRNRGVFAREYTYKDRTKDGRLRAQ